MTFDRLQPFNDLPLLPPDCILETTRVLKKAISANRAVAELKWAGHQLPNQTILLRAIALQEAKLSSEIENIVTTNDELYRAMADIDGKFDPHTKEVLRYQDALWSGIQSLRDRPLLTTNLFVRIVSTIKEADTNVRKGTGTRLANAANEIIYIPPEGEQVIRDKLANLEAFIHADDGLDPLVKLAVIHYQFEAIHPFVDGNGRTGRILNILFLMQQGLLELPVLYLSRYLIANKNDYLSGLRRVTEEQAWETWVLFMLEAVEQTALDTRGKITEIVSLMDSVQETVKSKAPGIYSKDLIEAIFQQPYCKIRFLEEQGIAKRQAAANYLRQLESLGVLQGIKLGRDVYFVNKPLLDILSR